MIEKICNEIDVTPEQLIIKHLQQENEQLKDRIKDKMQKLEQESDE